MVGAHNDTLVTRGWTASPSGRGTIDIIWSCGFTIFLCSWSVLCVNISVPRESWWRTCQRKAWLALICLLGPEFLVILAIGQWESARRSRADFRAIKYPQWSMKHAFFADMGGYLLKTKDHKPYPLNAKQLHYLITEGYISEDMVKKHVMLEKEVIDDKNKTDTLVRWITIFQVLWFFVTFVARACQHLAITTLELTTVGFITTAVAVSIFWAHKPADVSTACLLEIDASSEEIRARAGVSPAESWYRTPLDFILPAESYFSVYWTYNVNILQKLHLARRQKSRPVDSTPSDNFPATSFRSDVVALIISYVFFAINISGWNFWFPSTAERNLWRISSILLAGTMFIGFLTQTYLRYGVPWMENWSKHQNPTLTNDAGALPTKFQSKLGSRKASEVLGRGIRHLVGRLRNITPDGNPAFNVQVPVLIPGEILAALYGCGRAYLLIEDVLALRSLPAIAYDTVNWSEIFPHV